MLLLRLATNAGDAGRGRGGGAETLELADELQRKALAGAGIAAKFPLG